MIHKEEIVMTLCLGFSPYITRVAFRGLGGGEGGWRREHSSPPPLLDVCPLEILLYIL